MSTDIWNPWHGCRKCSAGCQNCYMFALDKSRDHPEWSGQVFRTKSFGLPLKKNRQKQFKISPGLRLRVNMTSDTFIEDAKPWLPEFWDIIKSRPDVIFWLLTKRPERIMQSLPPDWGQGYLNVSLNITTENQENFDKRWPVFKQIPAIHKGICCAPLLGPIDISPALASGQLDEVLAGGENYNNPRICELGWVTNLAAQCLTAKVNFCWYESGTNFAVNGHVMSWPRKADQGAIAYLSGVNSKLYEPEFTLFDPNDGHLLQKSELHQKTYNLNHCAFCANRMLCNGCLNCGRCRGPVVLSGLPELWQHERTLLVRSPPQVYEIYFRPR